MTNTLPEGEESILAIIQDALYATGAMTTDQCETVADGIFTYLKDANYKVVPAPPVAVPDEKESRVDSQEFYEIAYRYRFASITHPDEVTRRFEVLKQWVKDFASTQPTKEGSDAVEFYNYLHEEGYEFSDKVRYKVYRGGKYFWIQDIYKQFNPDHKSETQKLIDERDYYKRLAEAAAEVISLFDLTNQFLQSEYEKIENWYALKQQTPR